MILPEVMDEIVFSSLIAFNGKLTSHCGNLSTHHYHIVYYPCHDTQFCHSQTKQQYFCEIGKEKTRKLFWQRLDWQEKEILAKVVKDTKQQLNPTAVVVPIDRVAIIPALRVRHRVLFFVVFVPTKVLKSRRNVCLFLQITSNCTGTEYWKPCTFAKRSLHFQGIYLFSFNLYCVIIFIY